MADEAASIGANGDMHDRRPEAEPAATGGSGAPGPRQRKA
jgi:hypothetical protein